MYNTISIDAVKRMPFGTRNIGVHFSIKLRFTQDIAESILDTPRMNKHVQDVRICNTSYKGKQYTYITAVVHQMSDLMADLTIAKKIAEAAKHANKADEILNEVLHLKNLQTMLEI